MEQYSEEFLKYVQEIREKNHPITIPSMDVLYLIFISEQPKQDAKTTTKKSKK